MIAAIGKQLKQSVNVFQSLMLYRRLPVHAISQDHPENRERDDALTLVVKPVNSVNARTFMIASQYKEIFGVFDLVCEEETNGFERLFASIDIVTEEEVVGFWWEASVFKETQKIVVLTVNVTCPKVIALRESKGKELVTIKDVPQILMGASNSSRMGWLMKISRAFVHRYLISYSWSCTGFPGRLPRTGRLYRQNLSLSRSHNESGPKQDQGKHKR
jgi:hypothetical protein